MAITVAANYFPTFPTTLTEIIFHLLLIWFLLLATYLNQLANEMAASLSRAKLPSMDKQLQPHTEQMLCLAVPAIPGERNRVNHDLYVFSHKITYVETILFPFSLY